MKLDLPFFSSSLDDDDSNITNGSNSDHNSMMPVPSSNNNGRQQQQRPTAAASPLKNDISPSEAAFLCVKASLAEELTTGDEFYSALVMAGYNPTRKMIDRYWKRDDMTITFKEFDHILQTEPKPRKIDLLSYFRKLDPEGTGLIPHRDFAEILSKRGDLPVSDDVIRRYLSDSRLNREGHFDYHAFCSAAFETSLAATAAAAEAAAAKRAEQEINSKTYRVAKGGSPSRSSPMRRRTKRRGAFYFEGDSIIGHQYALRVKKGGRFQLDLRSPVDCQVFLFKMSPDPGARIGDTSLATFVARSQLRINSDLDNAASWSGNLDIGTYLLVPYTTGCQLKKRRKQPDASVQLVTKGGGDGLTLTDDFRRVLTDIYGQVDLDESGTLSRTEFNLFNWRTSGEEVQDEEWKVVKENFSLENGELSLDGFLQLHQMEAEDNGGDSAELWITLNAMGYNSLLKQDEAATFELSVGASEDNFSLEVSGLKAGGTSLDKAAIKCILQSAKQLGERGTRKLKGGQVVLYQEDAGFCSSWVIQNRSSDHVVLNLDFSESQNALINHPHMIFRTSLSPKTTVFVAHLIPDDASKETKVILKESLVEGSNSPRKHLSSNK